MNKTKPARIVRWGLGGLSLILLALAFVLYFLPLHEVAEVDLRLGTLGTAHSSGSQNTLVWVTHSGVDDTTLGMLPLLGLALFPGLLAFMSSRREPSLLSLPIYWLVAGACWYLGGLAMSAMKHSFDFGTRTNVFLAGTILDVTIMLLVLLAVLTPVIAHTLDRFRAQTGARAEHLNASET